jgi:hypothetical protein
MELPDDILYIIRDYSRSVTRPDWRTLHRMPSFNFHMAVAQSLNRNTVLSLLDFVVQDGNDFTHHVEFYDGLPYVVYIQGPSRVPFYVPF